MWTDEDGSEWFSSLHSVALWSTMSTFIKCGIYLRTLPPTVSLSVSQIVNSFIYSWIIHFTYIYADNLHNMLLSLTPNHESSVKLKLMDSYNLQTCISSRNKQKMAALNINWHTETVKDKLTQLVQGRWRHDNWNSKRNNSAMKHTFHLIIIIYYIYIYIYISCIYI